MEIEQRLRGMIRSGIKLTIDGPAPKGVGRTRFGGKPDVPPDFVWPYFETGTFDDPEVKPRPLSFLAQFDCSELKTLDTDHLLPETGLLSFFYELGSMAGGFDPKDQYCVKVCWFPDTTALAPSDFPAALEKEYQLPAVGIALKQQLELPCWEDFAEQPGLDLEQLGEKPWQRYRELARKAAEEWGACFESSNGDYSRLLGWPDTIQGSVPIECELTRQGIYMGGDRPIPREALEAAKRTAVNDWLLLFQLDSTENRDSGLDLMFGDCGSIYYYIRREDLAARRFDRVWLILQCY